ncbi:hypothetical protein TELCIR_02782 [Teladorsagia circumcincta]|uniref:Uncharacterized protein n=1 Tax=Teladorsagia circumcincta TaxID=45464 RepID=A0A2G9V097_TELCI|nr:hypothetical protein TELCIR_02782 [Teladorsagia circumcincta]
MRSRTNASLNINRKPYLESLPGDEIKDQWLGLAWHNFLDRQTSPWMATPPRPPKPAMHPKQGNVIKDKWFPVDLTYYPWMNARPQPPKTIPKPKQASLNIRRMPSLETSPGDLIEDQWLNLEWHDFLEREATPWMASPPRQPKASMQGALMPETTIGTVFPPPRTTTPKTQRGYSMPTIDVTTVDWSPAWNILNEIGPLEASLLRKGKQQLKRKPIMPKPTQGEITAPAAVLFFLTSFIFSHSKFTK